MVHSDTNMFVLDPSACFYYLVLSTQPALQVADLDRQILFYLLISFRLVVQLVLNSGNKI